MRIIIVLLLSCLFPIFVSAQQNSYTRQWSRVYRFELHGLPKSALQVVDSIYAKAKHENNFVEITRSILYQSKFALTLQSDGEGAEIERFRKEIGESKPPLKNLLESMLASIYMDYWKRNRWSYERRSQVTNPADDFKTWDASAMRTAIDRLFASSLQDATFTQAVDLTSIEELLAQSDARQYRPTLYDLLAHQALEFYTSDEGGLKKFYEASKDARLFYPFGTIPMDTMLSHKPVIRIYQSLYEFHSGKKDTIALIDAELNRLEWLATTGGFTNPKMLHKQALSRMKKTYSRHPVSAWIDFELAKIFRSEGDEFTKLEKGEHQFKYGIAMQYCDSAIARFPMSEAAKKSKLLKQQILDPSLTITSEKYLPVRLPSRLRVSYKNLIKIRCAVIPVSYAFEESFSRRLDSLKQEDIKQLRPDTTWNVTLRTLDDYQLHTTEVVMPALGAGHYMILVTVEGKRTFAYSFIQITDIALLESSHPNGVRYQVVNRNNGAPLKHARVTITKPQPERDSAVVHVRSDADGFIWPQDFNLDYSNVRIAVAHDNQEAVFNDYVSNYAGGRSEAEPLTAKTTMFTDRSIYRPGQTVYFKGILIKTLRGKSEVAPGEDVEIFLEDPEGNEVGTASVKTNAFGSFSGEFTIPASGLTGEYELYAEENFEEKSELYDADFDYESLEISVEEYKRPAFEVSFDKLTGVYQLNDTIRITGKAISFSGAELAGARVKYGIAREVNYRTYNRYRTNHGYTANFISGETIVNNKGEFTVSFYAGADESIPRESRPSFSFEIKADVTDIIGETRSNEATVNAGYHVFNTRLSGPDKVVKNTKASFMVTVTNLNDQPAQTYGTARIYRILNSTTSVRERPWASPDLPLLSRSEFQALFPYDIYSEEDLIPNRELIKEIPFQKDQTVISVLADRTWKVGEYQIEIDAYDPSGMNEIAEHDFVITENDKPLNTKLLWIEVDKKSYSVGDRVKVSIGSVVPGITVTIDIESNGEIIKTYTEVLSGNPMELIIPATELMTQGFKIHCSAAVFNSFASESEDVIVNSHRDDLSIETLSFRDKIKPGSEQTWSFRVRGTDAQRVEAELLASMYDASLDQFREHSWYFNPLRRERNYSYFNTQGGTGFTERNFSIVNQPYTVFSGERVYYEQLDWYGLSITNDSYVRMQYHNRLYTSMLAKDQMSKVVMMNDKNGKPGFIYGQVVSKEDGSPLPGVSVMVKGTTRGTQTDGDGNYELEAVQGETLTYSFIGLATLEATIIYKNTINVEMRGDEVLLNEVVVVAGGLTVQRRELGNQATTVTATDISQSQNMVTGLTGKVPGLLVSAISSGVDPAYRIVLRGNRSLLGNNQALIILDGVIVPGNIIENLSESDISSIDVLNGNAAAALYGSEASNGALIINTVSGQKKLDAEMAKVTARKIFNETAFFFPHLVPDRTGAVSFSFTTPESLTRWKLMLLAHSKKLLRSFKILELKTQKEFMTTVNAPRFLRAGDEVVLSAKINNLTQTSLKGTAALVLTDVVTGETVNEAFGNQTRNVSFQTASHGATELTWRLKVPRNIQALQYKVVASSGELSDGEQNILPVLSDQILVTESLPLYVNGGQTKTFVLDKLKNSTSATRKNHKLTLEFNANPVWYAVQALPYLMEFPHECAEQTFARYYSNILATHIINSNPKIKDVFTRWSDAKTLTSALEKNPELKSIILQETPWLRDAQSEAEQKKRVALLFDLKSMGDQLQAAVSKLGSIQRSSGGFPWFSGSDYESRYITQHIVSGFGHLKALNVEDSLSEYKMIVVEALRFLDKQILEDYLRLMKEAERVRLNNNNKPENEYLSRKRTDDLQIQYLYARSFFPDIKPYPEAEPVIAYYKQQAFTYWKDFPLYLKGMIAILAYRDQQYTLARSILNSVYENSIISEELGMYWKENTGGYYWQQADIETQALMIEAFNVLPPLTTETEKRTTIDALKTWLLKNKQVKQWKSTKATTEAVYAVLLTGTNWLETNETVNITVGNERISPETVEAGSGLFTMNWSGESIKPEQATVSISKPNAGVAWGGLYWQYFENLNNITAAETSLKLSRKMYKVAHTAQGDVLMEIKNDETLERGDLLRVRIEIRSDRAMEFLHLKDMRAAGLEPADVRSEHKWEDGLWYYQSTRDAATHFFFDSMKAGVYVLEYDLRASASGSFSTGIATLESMYAPEFSSHSEGSRIIIK